jgi:hypothetical protein
MREYLHFLTPLALTALIAGGIYYWSALRSDDGETCERDVDCVRRVCLGDDQGRYCSRECRDDTDCSEGWRCFRPAGGRRRNQSCLRP